MAYAPIAAIIPQYDEQIGWFLKFYQSNTTTPIAMATDSTGDTLLAKCQLDNDGFPTTDGTQLFIPHVLTSYDAYLFPSAALADANDTTNAKRVAQDNRPINSGGDASNVKDFGAIGDGVTDDSDAFQAWADQGGRLYIPRGTYRLTRQINFNKFVTVFGESTGSGTGGSEYAAQTEFETYQREAAAGAAIILPDVGNFTGEAVFSFISQGVENKAYSGIKLRDFKMQCPREKAVAAHFIHIVDFTII